MKKTFWNKLYDTFFGTFKGTDGEGSAKRATVFYITVVLITSMIFAYNYECRVSSESKNPTDVQKLIIEQRLAILYSLEFVLALFAGLATMETMTALVKAIRGIKEEKKETE